MVILNVNANPDYNDDKILEPLLETVRAIPIKETVSNWKESNYGLLYNGKRDWGYNTDGIIYINKDGEMQKAKETTSKIIGICKRN